MKSFSLIVGILLSLQSWCGFAVEIKICTVLHENKSSQCLSKEKQSFPATRLMGISKLERGEKTEIFTHSWNGAQASEVQVLERGRIVISTFQIPQGHSGSVAFSVTKADGSVLETKYLEVARGPLSISAHEIEAALSEEKVVRPSTSTSDDLPSLESLETDDTAEALSHLANDGGELPDVTEETLEETKAAVGSRSEATKEVNHAKEEETDQVGLILKRIEVHGAFVTQSDKGSSYTVLPFYAPEYRSTSFWGFGVRIGGTEFKQEKGKNITAIEGDIHLSLNFKTSRGRLTLQPTYGHHAWSKFGTNSSFGAMGEVKLHNIPLSILGGAQLWTHKKIDYRRVSVGLGVEF